MVQAIEVRRDVVDHRARITDEALQMGEGEQGHGISSFESEARSIYPLAQDPQSARRTGVPSQRPTGSTSRTKSRNAAT